MIKKLTKILGIIFVTLMLSNCTQSLDKIRKIEDFGQNWKFHLGDVKDANQPEFNDSEWRVLDVPHDWSIEGEFSKEHPAGSGGGALPGGIGWYRKIFTLQKEDANKLVFIDFGGIYMNSEVWINGHYLGKRPYGYSSYRYELTPYLKFDKENVLAVKVDNSQQPNSRWYTGSGIYRPVKLVTTGKVYVNHWGTYVKTKNVSQNSADVILETKISDRSSSTNNITLKTTIVNDNGKVVAEQAVKNVDPKQPVVQTLQVNQPKLWSDENPNLYRVMTQVCTDGKLMDDYETPLGIRYFEFHPEKGFFLNGEHKKIKGVCLHHDLGALGAAINFRALERQLEIMKSMGCNAIRTAHNPPAEELLDLCDKMGFIVMDEAFDVWKLKKSKYDYHLHWDEWHRRDLEDLILRDRNHPSVIIWSIGNEMIEQYDDESSLGKEITEKLAKIVRNLDDTRPITGGCNDTDLENISNILKSDALDMVGFNYSHDKFVDVPKYFPDKPFIATETESALSSRGDYDMPSDSIRVWPKAWDKPFYDGNDDYTCSSYDNCHVPWGSTHEETWSIVKNHDHISGMFIWTGFDYIGEPTPYSWPAKNSYFGLVDLCGFPKNGYYFYQAEWSDEPVLHLFPHWNWNKGDTIDVWAYTNYGEVELFLNDRSLGKKVKGAEDFQLVWPVAFEPGKLHAIASNEAGEILEQTIYTAGKAAKIIMEPDRSTIHADEKDLSFITVKVVDEKGNLVPRADNLIQFKVRGKGYVRAVDNGYPASHEPFIANQRKAYNGKCLAIIQSIDEPGIIEITARAEGLQSNTITIEAK
ncbi:MAG: beta-galactosidase GalB [Fidelibacterota bacterium]